MWYDWMVGGWGGRNGRDGPNCTSPVFGVGLAVQPLEGQERLTPVLTTEHQIIPDSGGPGRFRGGCGVRKGGTLTEPEGAGHVLLLRPRALDHLGHRGRPAVDPARRLADGATARTSASSARTSPNVDVGPGDVFTRPSAGGGGFGDPLERDPDAVLEDVADGYVTIERARATTASWSRRSTPSWPSTRSTPTRPRRSASASAARGAGWLEEDPEQVAGRFRDGELDTMDSIRRHGVILDWGTGELLPRTTEQFRAMLKRRAADHWNGG